MVNKHMKLFSSFLCTSLLVCAGVSNCLASNTSPRFVQDRFAIGLWVDPPMDNQADRRYKELSDANFTVVLGGFGAVGPKDAQRQIDLCRKYDMKALVSCRETSPDKLPTGPACWGYMIVDEPNANSFPDLSKKVDEIRSARPGKLAYINLYPKVGDDTTANGLYATSSYAEYLRRAAEEVGVDVLCMDHYPIFKPDGDSRQGYCNNLAAMREQSLRSHIPFWNFFNTMPFGPHTDPTEGQLRWQIFASIAYGAKGVLYFCYYTPVSPEFPKGGAILYRDGRLSRHYYQAMRINREVKNLGPTLMNLESTKVYRIAPGDDPAKVLAGSPIKNLIKADVDPQPDYLVGAFRHTDGRRAVLLQNYQFAFTAWPTVEFDAPADKVVEVDKFTGKEHPILDDSPEMPGLQISLDAGDARLFLLPK